MIATVYRIQNGVGRGPFCSRDCVDEWADFEFKRPPAKRYEPLPIEVRKAKAICPVAVFATGVLHPDHLSVWFSKEELMALETLGFRPVAVGGCRIIHKDEDTSVIFWRRWPMDIDFWNGVLPL
jgi:hypothetical protein